MKKENFISKFLFTTAYCFLTLAIILFSVSSGEDSTSQSGFFVNLIAVTLDLLNIRLLPSELDTLHNLVRKLIGHFALFGIDGIFGYLTFDSWFDWGNKKKFLITIILGILIATLSEVIQAFVPERGPSFVDVFIDLSGFILGVLFILLIQKIQRVSCLKKNPS